MDFGFSGSFDSWHGSPPIRIVDSLNAVVKASKIALFDHNVLVKGTTRALIDHKIGSVDPDSRRGAGDSVHGHHDRLRADREPAGYLDIDLSYSDQPGRDADKIDGRQGSADGHGGGLHRLRQISERRG